MVREKTLITLTTRVLKSAGVEYSEHLYWYLEHGGTAHSARALNVDVQLVI